MTLSRLLALVAVPVSSAVLVLAPRQTAAQAGSATPVIDGRAVPQTGDAVAPATPRRTTATAMRAERAPVLDGRDDDDVWRRAEPLTDFRMYVPREDGEPTYRTEARVAFDDRYFYALVRAFDPHPDSIVSLLSRRDVRTASDQIKIVIDSYHDRRSGYEFAVNPAGVKRDYTIYNDVEEDGSWDGVWDVATRIDSLGWVAEFRIPLSQLRFPAAASHTFGFGAYRDVARSGERVSWPLLRQSKFGFASQLGEVHGITGIGTLRRLEITPYTVTKNTTRTLARDASGTPSAFGRNQTISGGADIKYGLSSNLTLDATVNPDFGQVEADPAVVNLTTFETRFQERRLFFLEGNGIFRFDLNCDDGDCIGLFYSRRVGRAPQLAGLYGDDATPAAATILGATKLTGRLGSGLSVGVLNAVTQREVGSRDPLGGERRTVEPLSNYFVSRLQQDLRAGKAGVGLMVTAVNRSLDEFSQPYLRRSGYTAGTDFRSRFGRDNFEVAGYLAASLVQGDTAAIRRTQTSAAHNFQRPDDNLLLDPTRTSLAGDAEQISVGKVGGGVTRFNVAYQRFSPGFEINDAGFLPRVDLQTQGAWFGLQFNNARHFYRRLGINFNQYSQFTSQGLRTDLGGNVNGFTQLTNQWWVFTGLGMRQLPGSYNDRSAQGGPAIYRSPVVNGWIGFDGDGRMRVIPHFFMSLGRGDYGRTLFRFVQPSVELRASSRFSASFAPSYSRNSDDTQLYFFEPGLFAHLEYRQLAFGTRLNFTATPNLSLQVYAEPFISSGDFSSLREVDDPRASDYGRRYKPATRRGEPTDFSFKQFRSNTVLRWEYRPGSAIYLVWAQGREDSRDPGSFAARRDLQNLFASHPDNTFLVKASYWFSP